MDALPKLMLVENDPYLIFLLRRYAEESGFSVVSTSSGRNAMALACHEKPVVILLETNLPGITGWEVLEALDTDPETQDIPVVICIWPEDDISYSVEGIEAILYKPVQYEDFVTAMREAGVCQVNSDHQGRLQAPNSHLIEQ